MIWFTLTQDVREGREKGAQSRPWNDVGGQETQDALARGSDHEPSLEELAGDRPGLAVQLDPPHQADASNVLDRGNPTLQAEQLPLEPGAEVRDTLEKTRLLD